MRSLKLGGMGFFDVCFLHRRELDCPSRERLKQFHQIVDCEIAVAAQEQHGTELSFKLADLCSQKPPAPSIRAPVGLLAADFASSASASSDLPDLPSVQGIVLSNFRISATAGRAW